MECREARRFITQLSLLGEPERSQMLAHVQLCAACRDEVELAGQDPLAGISLPLAMPPPHLARRVMLQLPAASPLEIAARQRRIFRLYRYAAAAGLCALIVVALAGFILVQLAGLRAADVAGGIALPLVLAAKALLIALGKPWLAVIAALIMLTAPLLARRHMLAAPRGWFTLATRPAMVGGALVALLLSANAVAQPQGISTITTPVVVSQTAAGHVTSIAGDITIRGEVAGDVIALAGDVVLEAGAHVRGSVFSGAGPVERARATVDQAVIDGMAPLPVVAQVAGTTPSPAVAAGGATRIVALLGALTTLALAAIVVVAWPQVPLSARSYLLRAPLRALALGTLATLALLALAAGGTVLLAASVVGVLLVPVLLLLLHIPYIAGVAAIGETLGNVLTGQASISSALWGIAVQIVVVLALGLMAPALALLLFYVAGTVGLGGVLLGLSRHPLESWSTD